MKSYRALGCFVGLLVLLSTHGSAAVDLPDDMHLLEGFEAGTASNAVAEYDFCYKYVRGYQLLRLRDVYSDVSFALEACRLTESIQKVPENRLKDYLNLLAYAQLRSDIKCGSALQVARKTYEHWHDSRARLLEAWSLWNMSTSIRGTTQKAAGGRAAQQDRPGDYPGKGPITDDERRQWCLESRAILSELLQKEERAADNPLVYYVAGAVWSAPPFADQADPDKAAGYFTEYVRRAPALHSNFLSRAWAAERANTLAKRRLVDTDLFETDGHIIRCVRERFLWGQGTSQAAVVAKLKGLFPQRPPVSIRVGGGRIAFGLSQDAPPVDTKALQAIAAELHLKVVQDGAGQGQRDVVLQRTSEIDDGLSSPLVQNSVVRRLAMPKVATDGTPEQALRALAEGLRLENGLRIESAGERRQYRLFDAKELRLHYLTTDRTHFDFVVRLVGANPLWVPGTQSLQLQPDGKYNVELQVFVLDLFDPGPR